MFCWDTPVDMENKVTEDFSDSDNEIQFIEPLSFSGTLKPRDSPKASPPNYNENLGERIAGFISAFITVALIFGIYFTHMIFVFLPWMESREKEGYSYTDLFGILLWIGLGLMTLFVIMGLWSFAAALLTDNRVNFKNYEAEAKQMHKINNESNPASSNKCDQTAHDLRIKRWCKKCNQEKPMRAHHCSVCNACILRMDHHCPWINNCVGYRNHGHYLRFLFYVTAAMITGLFLMACRFSFFNGRYLYWHQQKNGAYIINLTEEMLQMTFLIADFVGCGILSLLIGLLLAVQLVNVSQGHTAIESLEIGQCERDMRREKKESKIAFHASDGEVPSETESEIAQNESVKKENTNGYSFPFPYDLGFDTNLKAIFGGNSLLWPFPLPIELNPLIGASRNGKKFETRPDALMNGQWPLPSKDPLLMMTSSRRGSLDDGGGFIVKNINYSLQDSTEK